MTKVKKKINNIKDLRNDLLEKYEVAKTKEEKEDLETFTQTASAIIRSLKVEMDYNKQKGNIMAIDFLEISKSE